MLTLGEAGWAQISEVNTEVNRRPYRVDMDLYGKPDHWTPIGPAGGDCEDFALRKQAELVAKGWPLRCLRLATCWVETGGYHAVLTVDTDRGTYVLDNRHPEPMPWDLLTRLGYRWDRRQAAEGRGWVKVAQVQRRA